MWWTPLRGAFGRLTITSIPALGFHADGAGKPDAAANPGRTPRFQSSRLDPTWLRFPFNLNKQSTFMGYMADAIAAYAQPLLDDTDGSGVQMNKALQIAQLCWNVATLPEEERTNVLGEMRTSLKMNAEEFELFRRSVLVPIIQRHQEMFPGMHRLGSTGPSERSQTPQTRPTTAVRSEKYPGTPRNTLCPCGSGRKYKKCCLEADAQRKQPALDQRRGTTAPERTVVTDLDELSNSVVDLITA